MKERFFRIFAAFLALSLAGCAGNRVKRLKKTGAELIFTTTTPVPDGTGIRVKGDAEEYNAAAERVMKKHGVTVNDLYSFAMPRLAEIQRANNVHFNEIGSRLLAEQVAGAILEKLER